MSRASRRFYRTLVIGLAALGVLVWAAVDQFGISPREVAEFFFGSVVIVVATIAFAACVAGLWISLRKYLRGDGTE